MEYLSLKNIVSLREGIEHEMELLLSNKAIVSKPEALQWRFFRDCFNRLLHPKSNSQFTSLSSSRAAQLKFETEDKLRRFYLRPGRKLNYVFQMIHKEDLESIFFDGADAYPDVAGYSVVIRDVSKEVGSDCGLSEKDVRDYIERVVVEAIEMEFQAYSELPEIIEDKVLDKCFHPSGSAKKEIMHVLLRHQEKGWVITNHMNPSTKRILSIKVRKIEKEEIFVSTTEYWYLRWWDSKNNSYTYPYRETCRQQYVLRKDHDVWKVYEFIRPAPRTSVPHRRKYAI
ncbi:MAG: hypothetical protein M1470_14995 [Bacteroidetes bacterium]|nr:hypothetical protein [Bacteroidota bacterium]MCL5738638.1 hypothetical protein [Bacteroidota bacterium]